MGSLLFLEVVMKVYNKRVWLNSTKSASTGSLVCYSGPSPFKEFKEFKKNKEERLVFVEVADCHQTIRLHQMYNETTKDFLKKIELLRDELTEYIQFLKV